MAWIVAMLLAGAVAEAPAAPDWSKPRSLPSLILEWRSEGKVAALVARDGVVFALTARGLLALDARTGAPLWKEPRIAGEHSFGGSPILVTDERVFVLDAARVWTLDKASGAVLQELDLPGNGWNLWGPTPVVQVKSGEDAYELVSLDPSSGLVAGRVPVPGWVTSLVVRGGVAVAVTSRTSESVARGLRLPDLVELWRSPGVDSVEESSGRVFVTRDVSDGRGCCARDFIEVDPLTGRLGAALPPTGRTDTSAGLPWDLDLVRRSGETDLLVRNDPRDGKPRWTLQLPGVLADWCRSGGMLYVHTAGAGRGFLLVVDWETGALLRRAYGLRDVRQIAVAEDRLVLAADEGLAAVSASELGPPEAGLKDLRDEVRRILDAPKDEWSLNAPILDLTALGAEGLPLLTEEAARRDGLDLRVLAVVLGAARHRPAAAVLAARLPGTDVALAGALLRALARAAGAAEVPAVAAVLEDTGRELEVRFEAFQALASIGTADAEAALERALAERSATGRGGPWAPSPAQYLDLIGKPLDSAKQDAAAGREDFVEFQRLSQGARSVRVSLPGGGGLILFADGQLGQSDDLWSVIQRAEGGLEGPATFLGAAVPGRFDARLEGRTLVVEGKEPKARPVRVDLDAVSRDSDGDGLADLVERRIGTDPDNPDTDGDGVADARDANPDHAPEAPAGEDQEIASEIFRQYFLFSHEAERGELLLVEYPAALDWAGRTGKTLTVAPGRADALRESAGHRAPILGLAPAGGPALRQPVTRPPGPDERLWHLSVYRGPLNAVGYDVVVRRIGGRWVIRELQVATVS